MAKKHLIHTATYLSILLSTTTLLSASSFQGLGDLIDNTGSNVINSTATALSANGQTVVGYDGKRLTDFSDSYAIYTRAFKHTSNSTTTLGNLNPDRPISVAYGVSADGQTIVGTARNTYVDTAFRWSQDTGIQALHAPNLFISSSAYDASANGQTIVGRVVTEPYDNFPTEFKPFVWTADQGLQIIAQSPNNDFIGHASAISNDGQTIVGTNYITPTHQQAFFYTQQQGIQTLESLTLDSTHTFAHNISGDGNVIVGEVYVEQQALAVKWDELGQIQPLDALSPLFDQTMATATNYDGSIIVGNAWNGSDQTTFIYHDNVGIQSLTAYLQDLGLEDQLEDWTLTTVNDISDDGLTIIGIGVNPDGDTESWIATIPEPATSLLLLTALPLCLGRRKH
ncbi:hypothetical protein KS4_21080 [Poriferisphaera corsica]|uniref:Extracellular repeat, HAF family n=1 Tax=Poriferisphaera corsica TaxID=2528020 RepID=A0A517YUZ8_9BACT|nr:PEP-CTERM sorting domain-containing protein [Poriferisphaera corsica]QDU34046.1 hypothetical protein KS4_21080 [Poriferisphaera corsica]